MGQILHKCARTTEIIRAEIQNSKEGVSKLARKFGVSRDTIYKWKSRNAINDNKSGTKSPKSSLSQLEQQIICEFRRKTKFSLDDCFIALKQEIPTLTRSNLHRVLQKNNLSKFADKNKKISRKKFKEYEIGFIHIDITFINIGKQKFYLFVAIERSTKLLFLKLYKDKTVKSSVDFLQETMKYFPFKIHRILTDNGVEFTYKLFSNNCHKKEEDHEFNKICFANNISHKTTQFRHPWTNGQVEIMNRQIKNNTTKKYKYDDYQQLSNHLNQYLLAYNFAKKLKSLNFKTPYQKMIEIYDRKRDNFKSEGVVGEFVGLYN